MGPAELLDYDRSKIRGVILEEGGKTSHVAIVARALGIPAVGQAEGLIDLVDTGKLDRHRWRHGRGVRRPSPDLQKCLCREGALLCAQAGAICGAARCAGGHQGWREDQSQHQCGADCRFAASAGFRRRRHRALPHRTAFHDGAAVPAPRLAGAPLPRPFSIRPTASRWFSARSISAPTRSCPICASRGRTIRRMGWRAIRMALDRPALLRLQVALCF